MYQLGTKDLLKLFQPYSGLPDDLYRADDGSIAERHCISDEIILFFNGEVVELMFAYRDGTVELVSDDSLSERASVFNNCIVYQMRSAESFV